MGKVRNILLAALLLTVSAQARHTRFNAFTFRAFPPTHQSLVDQNAEADRLNLPRIADDRQLDVLIERGELEQIPACRFLKFDKRLPEYRRYARPWAVAFIQALAADYFSEFETPLQVNSAVRTIKFQRHLRLWNKNAAPPTGQLASVHLAGIAIDVQRRGLSLAQLRFLQTRLMYYNARGDVIVEEELKQPCFHIVVRGTYPNLIPIESPSIGVAVIPLVGF